MNQYIVKLKPQIDFERLVEDIENKVNKLISGTHCSVGLYNDVGEDGEFVSLRIYGFINNYRDDTNDDIEYNWDFYIEDFINEDMEKVINDIADDIKASAKQILLDQIVDYKKEITKMEKLINLL